MIKEDQKYMRLALELAEKGYGKTWPNPMVGAVVVKNDRMIGQGWHKCYGAPHAEVMALKQAGLSAQGARLYVTLEPCCHYGKTPPCTDAIINANIKTVIAAMKDPDPKVSGRGFRLLTQAKIKVESGLLKKEAQNLNKVFIKRIKTNLPYIISKAAISMDGKIASYTRQSKWITDKQARVKTHELRSASQAVIIGGGTALVDDPLLTVRHKKIKKEDQPLRVVIEGKRTITRDSNLVKSAEQIPLLVITPKILKKHPLYGLQGVEIWSCPSNDNKIDIKYVLEKLNARGISQAMVEGGAALQAAFLGLDGSRSENLVDEIQWFVAPLIMGGERSISVVAGQGVKSPADGIKVNIQNIEPVGKDWLIQGRMEPHRQARGA